MEENKEPCHKQARQFIYRALNYEEKVQFLLFQNPKINIFRNSILPGSET